MTPMQGQVKPHSAHAPSSAPVIEFACLFTHDLVRKQKRWQDGRIRYHTFNKRVMVYDDRGNFMGDAHWTEDYDFDAGEEVRLERGGILTQCGDRLGSQIQDLSELIDKRVREKGERQAAAAARHSRLAPPGTSTVSRTAPMNPQPTHTSLLKVIGTPSGHYGRALIPIESPFQLRERVSNQRAGSRPRLDIHGPPPGRASVPLESVNQHSDETPSRPLKRPRRDNSPPSRRGYAQSLFGTPLTLSPMPASSVAAPHQARTKPFAEREPNTLPKPSKPSSQVGQDRMPGGSTYPLDNGQHNDQTPCSAKRREGGAVSPPSNRGYAQSLFGTVLTLSAMPVAAVKLRRKLVARPDQSTRMTWPDPSSKVAVDSRSCGLTDDTFVAPESVPIDHARIDTTEGSKHGEFRAQASPTTSKEARRKAGDESSKGHIDHDTDRPVESGQHAAGITTNPERGEQYTPVAGVTNRSGVQVGRRAARPEVIMIGDIETPTAHGHVSSAREEGNRKIPRHQKSASDALAPREVNASIAVIDIEEDSASSHHRHRAKTKRRDKGKMTAIKKKHLLERRSEEPRTELRIKPAKKRGLLIVSEQGQSGHTRTSGRAAAVNWPSCDSRNDRPDTDTAPTTVQAEDATDGDRGRRPGHGRHPQSIGARDDLNAPELLPTPRLAPLSRKSIRSKEVIGFVHSDDDTIGFNNCNPKAPIAPRASGKTQQITATEGNGTASKAIPGEDKNRDVCEPSSVSSGQRTEFSERASTAQKLETSFEGPVESALDRGPTTPDVVLRCTIAKGGPATANPGQGLSSLCPLGSASSWQEQRSERSCDAAQARREASGLSDAQRELSGQGMKQAGRRRLSEQTTDVPVIELGTATGHNLRRREDKMNKKSLDAERLARPKAVASFKPVTRVTAARPRKVAGQASDAAGPSSPSSKAAASCPLGQDTTMFPGGSNMDPWSREAFDLLECTRPRPA